MAEFAQYLINGLSQGAIYALIALGYTMVYGILQMINFAHGEFYMVGAFIGYRIFKRPGCRNQWLLWLSVPHGHACQKN